MLLKLEKERLFLVWMYSIYVSLLVSIIFMLRAVTSITIALLFISVIATQLFRKHDRRDSGLLVLVGAGLFYWVLQVPGFFYTNNPIQQWHSIVLKSCLVALPTSFFFSDFVNSQRRGYLLKIYVILVAIAAVYCLGAALFRWNSSHSSSEFFYFALVAPLKQHAVLFSILVFLVLVHAVESTRSNKPIFNKTIDIVLALFAASLLFLLSSKLILAFSLVYLVYVVIVDFKFTERKKILLFFAIGLVALASLLFFIPNPVNKRFREVASGSLGMVTEQKIGQGVYINGLQFRLMQWRFVPEILSENKAWLMGVSYGDKQTLLDSKYILADMYTGLASRADKGFLGYNAHNQFLESLLQGGIIGLLGYVFICIAMIRMALLKKHAELTCIVILLLVFSLSESVLESQYGIVLFTLLPLLLYPKDNSSAP